MRQSLAALGGEEQQFNQIVRVDQREAPPVEPRHHVYAESCDGAEQREPHPVGLAQNDRRADDGDGDAVGEAFGGAFSRQFAVAVVRDRLGPIGFGLRHAVIGRTGRRQRGYGDEHRRGGLRGARPRHVRHAALIHAVEVARDQRLREAGDVIDGLLSLDRGKDAGAIGYVAIHEAYARVLQRVDP